MFPFSALHLSFCCSLGELKTYSRGKIGLSILLHQHLKIFGYLNLNEKTKTQVVGVGAG